MNNYRDDSNLSSKANDIVRHKRTFLDQAVSSVPGFRGHSEKEALRRSDQIVRDILFKELSEVNLALKDSHRTIFETYGRSGEYNLLERTLIKNDTLMQKIIHAPRGYSLLFNSINIDQKALSRLTDYDAALEKDILVLKDDATGLKESISLKDQLNKKILSIDSIIDEIKNDFDRRDEVLKMIGE